METFHSRCLLFLLVNLPEIYADLIPSLRGSSAGENINWYNNVISSAVWGMVATCITWYCIKSGKWSFLGNFRWKSTWQNYLDMLFHRSLSWEDFSQVSMYKALSYILYLFVRFENNNNNNKKRGIYLTYCQLNIDIVCVKLIIKNIQNGRRSQLWIIDSVMYPWTDWGHAVDDTQTLRGHILNRLLLDLNWRYTKYRL